MPRVTAGLIREILTYYPRTGKWIWKRPRSTSIKSGSPAGANSHGYIRIKIFSKQYAAHRLAYLYMLGRWPKSRIDHKNGNGLDNRWTNLRLATHSQNIANAKMRCDNKHGCKGVSKEKGRYLAQICCNGKNHYLGRFSSPELAHAAYQVAAKKLFGSFARFR
jgi:hypothetical protein